MGVGFPHLQGLSTPERRVGVGVGSRQEILQQTSVNNETRVFSSQVLDYARRKSEVWQPAWIACLPRKDRLGTETILDLEAGMAHLLLGLDVTSL